MNFGYSYADLPSGFYSHQPVYKYPNAKIVILNNDLADDLGIDLSINNKQLLAQLLGYTSKKPISQAYAGHQFGNFTMLGDGRAILIGEYRKANGESVDIHLKGAGATKYSRGGDGKATLTAMLREYVVSESMYNLGVATSRILAVIATGENIQREELKQGAIAIRVASSHIRVGTFQYAAMLGQTYTQNLLDYTLKRHNITYKNNKALALLDYVIDKQSSLIVEWERIGFIHGVMNTDNMTISGETIDYGPCAFMDKYDPETVFSYIDREGRYAFANQAAIAGWNIARLAESLLRVISDNKEEAMELAQQKLEQFSKSYTYKWQRMFANKLGFNIFPERFDELVSDLLVLMQQNELDYINTFYSLSYVNSDSMPKFLQHWLEKWLDVFKKRNVAMMKIANPVIIPRNHLVNKALELAEKGNLIFLENLVSVTKSAYKFDARYKEYMKEPSKKEEVEFTFCGT